MREDTGQHQTETVPRAQLQAKIEELSRSNRELEQFAYVASHDLQEPLRMIANFVQLLDDEYGDAIRQLPGDGALYMQHIRAGSARAKHLIDALLEFSRVGRGMTRTWFPARQAVDDAMLILGPAPGERNAHVTVEDPLPTIYADREMVTRLFLNIIGNALKYRHPDRDPVIEITSDTDDDSWFFKIQDNGVGFEPGYGERVFDLFRRLRTDKNGTGIGLAICKKIVECHGGQITAVADPGEGASFGFILPKGES